MSESHNTKRLLSLPSLSHPSSPQSAITTDYCVLLPPPASTGTSSSSSSNAGAAAGSAGQLLVTAGLWDSSVRLLSVADGAVVQTLRGHCDVVTCLSGERGREGGRGGGF